MENKSTVPAGDRPRSRHSRHAPSPPPKSPLPPLTSMAGTPPWYAEYRPTTPQSWAVSGEEATPTRALQDQQGDLAPRPSTPTNRLSTVTEAATTPDSQILYETLDPPALPPAAVQRRRKGVPPPINTKKRASSAITRGVAELAGVFEAQKSDSEVFSRPTGPATSARSKSSNTTMPSTAVGLQTAVPRLGSAFEYDPGRSKSYGPVSSDSGSPERCLRVTNLSAVDIQRQADEQQGSFLDIPSNRVTLGSRNRSCPESKDSEDLYTATPPRSHASMMPQPLRTRSSGATNTTGMSSALQSLRSLSSQYPEAASNCNVEHNSYGHFPAPSRDHSNVVLQPPDARSSGASSSTNSDGTTLSSRHTPGQRNTVFDRLGGNGNYGCSSTSANINYDIPLPPLTPRPSHNSRSVGGQDYSPPSPSYNDIDGGYFKRLPTHLQAPQETLVGAKTFRSVLDAQRKGQSIPTYRTHNNTQYSQQVLADEHGFRRELNNSPSSTSRTSSVPKHGNSYARWAQRNDVLNHARDMNLASSRDPLAGSRDPPTAESTTTRMPQPRTAESDDEGSRLRREQLRKTCVKCGFKSMDLLVDNPVCCVDSPGEHRHACLDCWRKLLSDGLSSIDPEAWMRCQMCGEKLAPYDVQRLARLITRLRYRFKVLLRKLGDWRNRVLLQNFNPDRPRDISQFDERTQPGMKSTRSRSALSKGGLSNIDRTRKSRWPEADENGMLRPPTRTTFRS